MKAELFGDNVVKGDNDARDIPHTHTGQLFKFSILLYNLVKLRQLLIEGIAL